MSRASPQYSEPREADDKPLNTQHSHQSSRKTVRPTPKSTKRENSNSRASQQKGDNDAMFVSRGSEQVQMVYLASSSGFEHEDRKDKGLSVREGRLDEYDEDEENLVCARFPHLDFVPDEQEQKKEPVIISITQSLYIGDFNSGLQTRRLLQIGITHVLNVTATEYTKRTKYFKYQTIDVYDKSDEDIKKHFRITNRFINEALSNGGKVLIQDTDAKSTGPSFALAYLINNEKVPLKQGLDVLRNTLPQTEISPNFMKQLERYDLEKLALVTLKKKEIQ